MKKSLFILPLMILALQVNGQLRFGLKAGLSTTDIKSETLNLLDQGGAKRLELALKDANYGLHFGLALQANIGNIVIQPELNFNSNSVEWSVTDVKQPGTVDEVFKERFQYLDIPVLLGVRLGPLRLNAGPEGHVFVNSKSDLLDFQDYDQNFKNLTVGWLAGGGLDIWNLSIDVRYEGNFNNFGDYIRFAGKEYELSDSPNRWLTSLTYFFNRRKTGRN